MRMGLAVFAYVGSAVLLSACGEQPQTIAAKPGQSAAKLDDKPYNNDLFKNDKNAWQLQLKARADNQNEYKRVN